ncbi:MAG: glutamate--tRNA ligase [Streptosporangiales bacterium]
MTDAPRDRTVRTRFAPSPTGDLHIGNIRTALYSWAYARHCGGQFVLRIEDTDRSRVTDEYIAAAGDSLRWLGLTWDEGPEVGGPYGPYRQSERLELYREWANRFREQGNAYPCYCTQEELAEMRASQRERGVPPGYDGRCRDLTAAQIAAYEAEGRTPVLRFRMPAGTTLVHDLVRGEVTFDNATISDFVLMRADGSPLYQLAATVDDVLMKLTHIVRGDDLLSSVPRQVAIYRAMGVAEEDMPLFAHLPYVLGHDGSPLSKRHGSVTVSQYRRDGYLPEAMANYLALVGWHPADDREGFDLDDLVREFTLDRVGASSARFDVKKLDSINGDKIRTLPPAEFVRRITPFLQRDGLVTDPPDPAQEALVTAAAPLVQERIVHLTEASGMLGFLLVAEEEFAVDADAAERALGADAEPVVAAATTALEAVSEWQHEPIERALRTSLVDELGLKPKHAFTPVRVATTGRRVSPPLFESLELLGRERTLRRLRAAKQS